MRSISKDYHKEVWDQYFKLDSSSPSGLVWKVDRGNGKSRPGDSVGYKASTGHWKAEIKGKGVQLNRVIYYLTYNTLDASLVVDHIDGNPSNNSIDNLRLVPFHTNMRNKKMPKNVTTGKTGVYEVHEFVANWVEDGKLRSKGFKVSKYGSRELALEAASTYRDGQIARLNSLGYGYTHDHGVNR